MSCDVDKATEGLEMGFDVGEVMERLENELCLLRRRSERRVGE